MDFAGMLGKLVAHMNVITCVLFVLIMAEEVVANLPFIRSNSLGQLILSSVKALLMKVWGEKTQG